MGEVTDHHHVEDPSAHQGFGPLQVDGLHPVPRKHLKHVNVNVTVHQQQPITYRCNTTLISFYCAFTYHTWFKL